MKMQAHESEHRATQSNIERMREQGEQFDRRAHELGVAIKDADEPLEVLQKTLQELLGARNQKQQALNQSQENVTQLLSKPGVRIEFDTTAGADFGRDLYFCDGVTIKRITPEGDVTSLLSSDRYIQDFAFGWDGGLYVTEVDSSSTLIDTVTISKITVVPEPASLLLFGFGTLASCLHRRRWWNSFRDSFDRDGKWSWSIHHLLPA